MLELRCRNNKKAAEFDPDTLSLLIPCATCTDVWGRKVYHRWTVADVLRAVGNGNHDGIVHPAEAVALGDDDLVCPVG